MDQVSSGKEGPSSFSGSRRKVRHGDTRLAHTLPGQPTIHQPGSAQRILCLAKQQKDLKERAQMGSPRPPHFPRTPGSAMRKGRRTAPICPSHLCHMWIWVGENRGPKQLPQTKGLKTMELHSPPVQEPRTLRPRGRGRVGSFWELQASCSILEFADLPWCSSAVGAAPVPARGPHSRFCVSFSGQHSLQ